MVFLPIDTKSMYLKSCTSLLNNTPLKSIKIASFLHQSFDFYCISRTRFSSSSLANISDSQPSSISSSLYSFLPHTQNPNNIVDVICSSFRKNGEKPNFSVLEKDSKWVISHLGNQEISRVLLRCQSDSDTALCFFNWVRNDLCVSPNVHNYCVIVHILACCKNFKQAMALMLEVVELSKSRSVSGDSDVFEVLVLCTNECSWEPGVFEMLAKAYVKKGMVREGFVAFEEMLRFGLVPSVVTVNCLMNGLAKFNYVDRCWYLFEEMRRIGIHANCFTFNILTHVLCKGEDVDKVNRFLDEMGEEGFIPDVVTYNTLIDSYCKKRRLKDAIYLFNIMYRRGVLPDLVTHTALINGYCRDMKMREAHKLFNCMIQEGLCPDVTCYNTLICGYCKEGMMQEARTLLRDMIGNGVPPDNLSCWILVKGYEKQDRLLSALNLLVELQRFNVSIPKDIYNYLIVALCQDNKAMAAKNLLERMSIDGHETTEKIFNEIIICLCKRNYVEEALTLKADMVYKGFKSSLDTYRAVICCLCRSCRNVEGESLMREMIESGFLPDVGILRALVNGFCAERNVYKAELLLSLFAVEFHIFDTECYNVLLKVLSEDGDIAKLMSFQDSMLKLGISPNATTFRHIIDAMSKSVESDLNKVCAN